MKNTPPTPSSQPKVRFIRLLKLFVFANIGLVATGFVVIAAMGESADIHAFGWHFIHGRDLTYQGHRFTIPTVYDPREVPGYGAVSFEDHHAFRGGLELIDFTIDDKAERDPVTLHWAEDRAKVINAHSKIGLMMQSQIIQGKRLTFVCMHDSITNLGIDLHCRTLNAPIVVDVMASKGYEARALNILRTSD